MPSSFHTRALDAPAGVLAKQTSYHHAQRSGLPRLPAQKGLLDRNGGEGPGQMGPDRDAWRRNEGCATTEVPIARLQHLEIDRQNVYQTCVLFLSASNAMQYD